MGLHSYLMPDLAGLAVRPLCLVALASLGLRSRRCSSASVKHAVWTVVLAGMLLQAVMGPVLPPVLFRILSPLETVNPLAEERAPRPVARAEAAASTPRAREARLEQAHTWPEMSWRRALSGIYTVGAIICLAELLLGYLRTRRLSRIGASIRGWPCSQSAELFESPLVSVPVTVGYIRPKILLPAAWREWEAVKVRAVLAHEEAHVRRADWIVGVLAQVNCSLFWFHPLAWWLRRRLAALAEQACDDSALALVKDREQYAQVLLDIARDANSARGRLRWEMISMAKEASVRKRIDRILDENRPIPKAIGRLGWAVLLAGGLPLAFLAAAAQLAPAQTKSASPSTGALASFLGSWRLNSSASVQEGGPRPANFTHMFGDTTYALDKDGNLVATVSIGNVFVFRIDGKPLASYGVRAKYVLPGYATCNSQEHGAVFTMLDAQWDPIIFQPANPEKLLTTTVSCYSGTEDRVLDLKTYDKGGRLVGADRRTGSPDDRVMTDVGSGVYQGEYFRFVFVWNKQ